MTGVSLRELIQRRPVVGTMIKMPRREVVEIVASAGFDFAVCDLEHSQMTIAGALVVVNSARAMGFPVVVRVPSPDRGAINVLLEAGATGLQAPRIEMDEDILSYRDLVYYPPIGTRSISLAQPRARYGTADLADFVVGANREAMLIGQIETLGDQTMPARLDLLDVVFVGPVDLLVHAGFDRQRAAERTRQAIDSAAELGIPVGTFTATAASIEEVFRQGYRYVVVGSDLSFLADASRAAVSVMNEMRRVENVSG